jgi:hypothetical protein
MDDTFQFIIESPQHSQGHKKRPRLVTSCDNWYACTRFPPPFLQAFFVTVVSRRSSVYNLLPKQNVKPAKLPKSPVDSGIESVILLSEAGLSQVPILVCTPLS